jgi:hypothetical protein
MKNQMNKGKQDKVAGPAATDSTLTSRIGHWVRVVVACLSFGFIFPHAFTEKDDRAKYAADKEAKTRQ